MAEKYLFRFGKTLNLPRLVKTCQDNRPTERELPRLVKTCRDNRPTERELPIPVKTQNCLDLSRPDKTWQKQRLGKTWQDNRAAEGDLPRLAKTNRATERYLPNPDKTQDLPGLARTCHDLSRLKT